MSLVARFFMFDCDDPKRLAQFWSSALAEEIEPFGGSLSLRFTTRLESRALFTTNFRAERRVKSHLHIEFTVKQGALADEVDRLLALGATLLDDRRRDGFDGVGWVIMADPEGNEFRVQSNDEEVDALESRLAWEASE